MHTTPGLIAQATAFLHGASAPNAGAKAGIMLDALLRQNTAARGMLQAWYEARLTRRR